MNILGDCLTLVVDGVTSPWYIPSFEEFEIAFNKDKVKPTNNQTNACSYSKHISLDLSQNLKVCK